ncbi:hypothetical protein NEOLEDRAFT_1129858 [Neolentinus lepideus HHB14362 ss-1]|uniref:Uncharacterized protein n=1 Tax=Neolentinus lepideus HHB14362 ss-1 TaxID=1314782 RepID=A0A165UCZ5_9AGAM|nr:hypothetical protein NEOLEDRAFT_1129858 [Neolentinus lepideus HHB14362 ss-1]
MTLASSTPSCLGAVVEAPWRLSGQIAEQLQKHGRSFEFILPVFNWNAWIYIICSPSSVLFAANDVCGSAWVSTTPLRQEVKRSLQDSQPCEQFGISEGALRQQSSQLTNAIQSTTPTTQMLRVTKHPKLYCRHRRPSWKSSQNLMNKRLDGHDWTGLRR